MKSMIQCAGAVLLLALAACQTTQVETAPVSQTMEPMEYRQLVEGEVFQWQQADGDIRETEVLAVSDGMATLRDSDGCTWTQRTGGFPPSTEWSNCQDSSGSHDLTREGNIFPLTVGATETWRFTGRNNRGDTWEGERVCNVTEAVQVTVPAGTFDTYHVVCNDPWRVREWYIASETQRPVLYKRQHKQRAADRVYQELVSNTAPTT